MNILRRKGFERIKRFKVGEWEEDMRLREMLNEILKKYSKIDKYITKEEKENINNIIKEMNQLTKSIRRERQDVKQETGELLKGFLQSLQEGKYLKRMNEEIDEILKEVKVIDEIEDDMTVSVRMCYIYSKKIANRIKSDEESQKYKRIVMELDDFLKEKIKKSGIRFINKENKKKIKSLYIAMKEIEKDLQQEEIGYIYRKMEKIKERI